MIEEELEEILAEVKEDMLSYSEVDEEVLDEFIERIKPKILALIHNDPFDDEDNELE